MNNYCRNCGEKLNNTKICDKCNTKVIKDRVGEVDKELETKYKNVFFALVGINIIGLIFMRLSLSVVTFIYVIVAKKNLKYSKFFNIVFWIMLFLAIISVLLVLFMLISCEYTF